MPWQTSGPDRTCIEFGIEDMRPTLSCRRVSETLGVAPSRISTRKGEHGTPQKIDSWFFNSLALTDSENIGDHITVLAALLESKKRRLRKMTKHCAFATIRICLQYLTPGDATLRMNELLRLNRLAFAGGIEIHLFPAVPPCQGDTMDHGIKRETPSFRYVHTLTRVRGERRDYEKREYRFEVAGSTFLPGTHGETLDKSMAFRQSLLTGIRKQRGIMLPFIQNGFQGRFQSFRRFGSSRDYFSKRELHILRGITDTIVFTLL